MAVDCCEYTGAPVVGDTAAVIVIESGDGGPVSGLTIYAEGCSQVANDNCEYQDQYCLAPHHRLLTADLRWIPCGEIEEGDRLLAFEEQRQPDKRNRRLEMATVLKSSPAEKECAEVTLSNGDQIICSLDHPWLAMDGVVKNGIPGPRTRRWKETQALTNRDWVSRLFAPWTEEDSFAAGWLSGMWDGEGSLTRGKSLRASIAQKTGPVLDRIRHELDVRKFPFSETLHADTDVSYLTIAQQEEVVRLLGMIRPMRLLRTFEEAAVYKSWSIKTPNRCSILSVRPVGKQLVQSIATDTRTYIGEGFLMHNSDTYCDVTAGGLYPNATVSDFSFTINDMPANAILTIDSAEQSVSLTDETGNIYLSQLEAIDWLGLFEWIVAAKNGCQKICIDSDGATINAGTTWSVSTFDREL